MGRFGQETIPIFFSLANSHIGLCTKDHLQIQEGADCSTDRHARNKGRFIRKLKHRIEKSDF